VKRAELKTEEAHALDLSNFPTVSPLGPTSKVPTQVAEKTKNEL